jgi:hypothetical protein
MTRRNRAGLVLAVLMGIGRVSWSAVTNGSRAPGELGPPSGVVWLTLGLSTIAIVSGTYAWVRGKRGGLRVAAAATTVPALLASPGLLVDGVPTPLVVAASADILLTAVTVTLLTTAA